MLMLHGLQDGHLTWGPVVSSLARDLNDFVVGLDQRGVGLRPPHGSIDTRSAAGKLTFHIFGALAEFESALVRERSSSSSRPAPSRTAVESQSLALRAAPGPRQSEWHLGPRYSTSAPC